MEAVSDSSTAAARVNDDGGRQRHAYLKRFQLLGYREVTRLCDVMETTVPIHGTGNFPTLEIQPSVLVQTVKRRLEDIGVRVPNIRLNGSAATHVLSEHQVPAYKDLDLIFSIDFLPDDHPPPTTASSSSSDDDARSSVEDDDDGAGAVRPTWLSTAPSARRKSRCGDDDASSAVDDSGYASSESSLSSFPPSPSVPVMPPPAPFARKHPAPHQRRATRSRDHSTDSATATPEHDVRRAADHYPYQLLLQHQRDQCWQKVKDTVMEILLEYLPAQVNRTRINSQVLANAYVQKMVKVTNEADKWSLISLNNNTGRNLELKFVQSMRRQYEFSVDSFQIELGSFLEFRRVASSTPAAVTTGDSSSSSPGAIEMSARFHPTVMAESVYGDFAASLRHLRYRRICTFRPEEIRGGGLLRYCNLLVRDFRPGDCDERGREPAPSGDDAAAAARLEQHMCSRFFIDFSDIRHQRKKLISYLNNHFAGEDDLKFQYLLVLRRVVDARTVCLMQHERALIVDLITALVRQTLASNVAKSTQQQQHQQAVDFYPHHQPAAAYSYEQPEYSCAPLRTALSAPTAVSERSSSPMSAPSTPDVQSRPSTPGCQDTAAAGVAHAHNVYHRTPVYAAPACCCCCCCCCCSARQMNDQYLYHHHHHHCAGAAPPGRYDGAHYPLAVPHAPTSFANVFYASDTTTCFYQPAMSAPPSAPGQ